MPTLIICASLSFVDGRKAKSDAGFNYLATCSSNSPPALVAGNEKLPDSFDTNQALPTK